MKKTKLLIGVLCACLILSACGQVPSEAAPDYKLTENQYVDYTFEYPEAWSLTRNDGMIAVKSAEDNVTITCTSFDIDNNTYTAKDYWDGYFESYKATFGDKVQVITQEETKLGDAPAIYVTYNAEIVGEQFTFTQVTAVRNGTAYTLTYTAKPESYDTYKPALTHAITSFKFNH